jgi:hypothetical protein
MKYQLWELNVRSWQVWCLSLFSIGWGILVMSAAFVWNPDVIVRVLSACGVFVIFVPFALFVAFPTMRRNANRVWAAHGLCTRCGYDLRQIHSDRCPECGEVVVGRASARH